MAVTVPRWLEAVGQLFQREWQCEHRPCSCVHGGSENFGASAAGEQNDRDERMGTRELLHSGECRGICKRFIYKDAGDIASIKRLSQTF